MFPDPTYLQQCSRKTWFSFLLWTGASPSSSQLSAQAEMDGVQIQQLWAEESPGSRRWAGSFIQMAKEVGSGGAGSHPNRVRGRGALPFSARISALPFLHAGLFQSPTGYQIPFQPLVVCWFLNQIPHLGLIKLTNYPPSPTPSHLF